MFVWLWTIISLNQFGIGGGGISTNSTNFISNFSKDIRLYILQQCSQCCQTSEIISEFFSEIRSENLSEIDFRVKVLEKMISYTLKILFVRMNYV